MHTYLTSIKDSNKALVRIHPGKDPSESVDSQTLDLQIDSNIVHPVAYISGPFSQSQCTWPTIT